MYSKLLTLYNGQSLVGHFNSTEDIEKFVESQRKLGEDTGNYCIIEKFIKI